MVDTIASAFARTASAVAFNDEQFRALAGFRSAIGEFSWQAQFLSGRFTLRLFFLPAAQTLFCAQDQKVEDRAGGFRIGCKPIVKPVTYGIFHQALGFNRGQTILGLPNEFRLADETRD